jgi:PAS domain-containing protein
MLGMAVDITERKDAEESLRRKEIELKEAQRLAGVGSWQWDPETDTVVWSEELYRIAGRDPSLPALNYKEHAQPSAIPPARSRSSAARSRTSRSASLPKKRCPA